MGYQNKVILSIGSNQGKRLENIQGCIDLLYKEIGTVIRVSPLYETPAWGFKSDLFYNCTLLLHTNKTAEDILKDISALEKKLGRVQKQKSGYEARIIDIDIIAFNEEIITTEKLQVPHPQMQNRRFVLQPMNDLNLDFVHPIFNKNIQELLDNCSDYSTCKRINNLTLPLRGFNLGYCNYVAIEGNIGAGKTTLVTKIAEDFNAKKVLERFTENLFLPKFYNDQARFAFSVEMSFLVDRYQQLSDDLAQYDLFKDFILADYNIFKSLIFSKITLSEDEYRVYRKFFDIISKEMKKPDLYVYLYQNTNKLLENIKNRGRDYEQGIQVEYLNKINKGYFDYIKSQPDLNVLTIDISDRDFVKNQADYIFILEAIQAKLDTAIGF